MRIKRKGHLHSVPQSTAARWLDWTPVDLEVPERMKDPVWVELITGRVFGIPRASVAGRADRMVLRQVPMWDSPVIVAPRAAIPLQAK